MNAQKFFQKKSPEDWAKEMNQHFFEDQVVVPVVSIDDGYAQCNSALLAVEMSDGEPTLRILESKRPSLGRRGRHTAGFAGGAQNLFGRYDLKEEYTISPFVPSPEDTRTDDYATTSLNLFLVHAVLDDLGLAGHDVAILTGLPLAQFMDGENEINSRLISKKQQNLMAPVYMGTSQKPSAQIRSVNVYPEAVCGMVDYLIDEYGDLKEGRSPDVVRLGIDIGGNTTDMTIVLPGNQVGARMTIKYGVSHVKDRLKRLLSARFDTEADDATLESALRDKAVSWFGGEPDDVSDEVADAIASVMDPIITEVDQFKKQFPSLKEIVGFGGGVALMQTIIRERYPRIIVLDDADGANARGALKYAMVYDLESIMATVVDAMNKAAEAV